MMQKRKRKEGREGGRMRVLSGTRYVGDVSSLWLYGSGMFENRQGGGGRESYEFGIKRVLGVEL